MTIITVKQGKLQGKKVKSSLSGKTFYSFLGIPYAKPPIGSLRFQAPLAHGGWKDVLDATEKRSCCSQINHLLRSTDITGEEDCLFLNIYTPEDPRKIQTPKPVMVFIHGGGFTSSDGSSDLYSPDFLMDYDIILVTVNYRLSVLGFLNLSVEECSGNAGLKDQILALKWVKDNIVKFGGDSENITAFGESAGAMSVNFLMISPNAKGLFKRAILQSGSCLSNWAFSEFPTMDAYKLVNSLNGHWTTREDALEFLKSVPVNDLIKAATKLDNENYRKPFVSSIFKPSLEIVGDKSLMVLPDYPHVLLKSAPAIPLITGMNDLEGLIYLMTVTSRITYAVDQGDHNIIPSDLKNTVSNLDKISNEIKKFYFGVKPINSDSLMELIHYFSDIFFGRFFYETFDEMLKNNPENPVYLYKFSYDGQLNYSKMMYSARSNMPLSGSVHGDELFYMFFPKLLQYATEYESDTLKVIKNICTFWTNFAKTGDPNGTENKIWIPTSLENPCYLQITEKLKMVKGKIDQERLEFWDKLNKYSYNEINILSKL